MKRLLVLGLVGCGDPLVGAEYRGEPILRLTGQIESVGPGAPVDEASALVSMFWNTDLSSVPPTLVPQSSVSAVIAFPSSFEIRVFDPPTSAHLVQSDGRYGIALLLVYADRDGDGAYGVGDALIGGNLSKAIVWASETIAAADSPFSTELPEGFSLVNEPFMRCMGPPTGQFRPPPEGESHVRSCSSDASCPSDFVCDLTFAVCVPRDSFEIVIGGNFDLNAADCRRR